MIQYVWLLTEELGYEGRNVIGVFSTIQKAKAYAQEFHDNMGLGELLDEWTPETQILGEKVKAALEAEWYGKVYRIECQFLDDPEGDQE